MTRAALAVVLLSALGFAGCHQDFGQGAGAAVQASKSTSPSGQGTVERDAAQEARLTAQGGLPWVFRIRDGRMRGWLRTSPDSKVEKLVLTEQVGYGKNVDCGLVVALGPIEFTPGDTRQRCKVEYLAVSTGGEAKSTTTFPVHFTGVAEVTPLKVDVYAGWKEGADGKQEPDPATRYTMLELEWVE